MNKIAKLAIIIAILIFTASALIMKTLLGREKVVVANVNITAGTRLTRNMLKEEDIPVLARVSGSTIRADGLVGKTILVDRYKNDQIGSVMVGDPRKELNEGEGLITLNISKAEADNIRPGQNICLITYQNNGETKEISGFKVNKMSQSVSKLSGQEECILTLANQTKANEAVAPYLKSANFKVEVVGD